MNRTTFANAIKNARHHKALGQTDIYLDGEIGDMPWHLAASCEAGGSHRLDIATSVWFRGKDPKTGLSFRWSFDIEPMEANGKGHYEIDAEACRKVMSLLAPKAAETFKKYLLECSLAVHKKGAEWQKLANRQFADSQTLAAIATQ